LKPKVLIPEECDALEELLGPSVFEEANEIVRNISQTIRLQQKNKTKKQTNKKQKNAANV